MCEYYFINGKVEIYDFEININEANKCVCEKCGGIYQENDLYRDINPVYLCENCFTKIWQGEG